MGTSATKPDGQECPSVGSHIPDTRSFPTGSTTELQNTCSLTSNTGEASSRKKGYLKTAEAKSSGMFSMDDLHNLVGNLEKLPDSARKLFGMAKLYLSTGSSDCTDKRDFLSLFHVLPATESGSAGVDDDDDDDDVTSDAAKKKSELQVKCAESLFMPMRRSAPLQYAQTYIQWKAARDLSNLYSLCLPKRTTIYLQPIDEFPDFVSKFKFQMHHLNLNFFETLQGFAQIFFSGFDVLISPSVSMEARGWKVRSRYHESTNRKQYCVNDMYPLLQSMLPGDGFCVAGVIWTDIYPEGFNFVLGEASFRHKAAVISFGRFEPSGVHQDVTEVDGIIMWRLLKSLSHELCHLFGLEHCTYFLCAMNESSRVSDAMSHPLFLCPICLRKLQRACGFDVLERYQQLRQFLGALVQQLDQTSKFEESLTWLDRCVEYLNS